ncbi:MAG: hypothetical protein WCL49_11350 [bacterium]
MRIEDLPPRLQAQVRAQLATDAKPAECRTIDLESAPTPTPVPSVDRGTREQREPNKTESDYRATYLRGLDARYEAVTFRMANGHRYTPDWVVFTDGRPSQCHECKGGHALHSQQRARLAFDQVRVEFPGLVWVWAVRVGGQWTVDSGQ